MSDHVDDEVLQGLREIMEDGFTELLEVFLRESAAQHAQLQTLWRSGDRATIVGLAHSLKGSCANIGAKGCAGIAAEVEKLAHQGNWDEVPSLLQALDLEMKVAHGELSRLC